MKPLDNVKVLEFSTMITASLAAMMMAEQGAEVIKVEPIELGDPMRYLGSSKGGISALFANCNRGKQSLRLDIKGAAGKAIVLQLASDADVVLCNFRPGVMDALGLGSAQLRARNERLIYAAVSGFGTEGPDRDNPAYDPIIQAQAGFAAVQGQGQQKLEFVRNLVCDKITAYTAIQAVTAALYVREKTGTGQHIDLSMMDAGLYFLFPDGFMHQTLLDDDAEHRPPLSELLYELAETSDGGLTISAGTEAQQVGLLNAIGELPLLADERFNSIAKLVANIGEFRALIREKMKSCTSDELLARLRANDVPAAKCLSYEEVLGHAQYAANSSIDEHPHPLLGNIRRVRYPARFAGDQLPPASDAPAHGGQTHSVLARLGRSPAEIAALIEQGVVRSAD